MVDTKTLLIGGAAVGGAFLLLQHTGGGTPEPGETDHLPTSLAGEVANAKADCGVSGEPAGLVEKSGGGQSYVYHTRNSCELNTLINLGWSPVNPSVTRDERGVGGKYR